MDLRNELCLSVRPAGWPPCMARTVALDITQPDLLIPAMLIGAIDFSHFIPLSQTLTLAWGHKVCKAKPLGFIFSHTFQLIRIKFDVVLKQFKLNILIQHFE